VRVAPAPIVIAVVSSLLTCTAAAGLPRCNAVQVSKQVRKAPVKTQKLLDARVYAARVYAARVYRAVVSDPTAPVAIVALLVALLLGVAEVAATAFAPPPTTRAMVYQFPTAQATPTIALPVAPSPTVAPPEAPTDAPQAPQAPAPVQVVYMAPAPVVPPSVPSVPVQVEVAPALPAPIRERAPTRTPALAPANGQGDGYKPCTHPRCN
jgi:hypothetical protein